MITERMTSRISFRIPESVRIREDVFPIYCQVRVKAGGTRKTTATFRQNATAAFMKSMNSPASVIALILNVGPSNTKQQIPFITAHTGAK